MKGAVTIMDPITLVNMSGKHVRNEESKQTRTLTAVAGTSVCPPCPFLFVRALYRQHGVFVRVLTCLYMC